MFHGSVGSIITEKVVVNGIRPMSPGGDFFLENFEGQPFILNTNVKVHDRNNTAKIYN
jgi:hypothetical protein